MAEQVGVSLSERVKYKRGQSPNSQKNLKPFPKGSNGGLNKRGYSLTAALKHALTNDAKRRELVESTIAGAILREPAPFREVWDRVEGKVAERHQILGDINIEVVFEDRLGRVIVEGEDKGIVVPPNV